MQQAHQRELGKRRAVHPGRGGEDQVGVHEPGSLEERADAGAGGLHPAQLRAELRHVGGRLPVEVEADVGLLAQLRPPIQIGGRQLSRHAGVVALIPGHGQQLRRIQQPEPVVGGRDAGHLLRFQQRGDQDVDRSRNRHASSFDGRLSTVNEYLAAAPCVKSRVSDVRLNDERATGIDQVLTARKRRSYSCGVVDNRRMECDMVRATPSRFLSIVGLISLTAMAAACGGSGSGSGSGGPGTSAKVTTLVIANAVKVDTLDPEANSVNESIWLDQNLYSRLLQPNSTGTGLLPDLAQTWTITPDGLTYTFHLRTDAKFSNGTPVTAADVVYSIDRSRAFKGGWGFLLTAVKTVTSPDAHTVVITLSQPHAPLLADLAMYAYSVVPESLVKAQGSAFFQHPVGSGPFMVTSYSPDSEVDLAANPHFYATKPKISKVRVLIVPDDNTRVLMLESKKADVIENPPGSLVNQIDKTPGLSVQLFPSTRVDFVQLDEHFKPFKNVLVRQAINYALDRNAIVKLAYQGHAVAGASFLPYKMQYYDSS